MAIVSRVQWQEVGLDSPFEIDAGIANTVACIDYKTYVAIWLSVRRTLFGTAGTPKFV